MEALKFKEAEYVREIPSSVIELAQKAESIDLKKISRKRLFIIAVILGSLAAIAVDLWAVSQGFVTTDPAKKFAALVGLLAGAALVVGILSQLALDRLL